MSRPFGRSTRLAAAAACIAAWHLAGAPAQAAGPCGASYAMQAGDTLSKVARSCGVTLPALRDANPQLGPATAISIGTQLTMPGEQPAAAAASATPAEEPQNPAIRLRPVSGVPGTRIAVMGDGYRPGDTVTVGVGEPESEWRKVEEVQVRPTGMVQALVRIPETARPGREIVFVIHTKDGRTETSRPVDVVEAAPTD